MVGAPTARKLCDVLAAVSAERLGSKMAGMIVGGINLRPASPGFFAFVLGTDGGWTPYKLRPDAVGAHVNLARNWERYKGLLQVSVQVYGVEAHHFANDLGCSSPPASYAGSLPGIEEGLVVWLGERGYGAEAKFVRLEEAPAWIRVIRCHLVKPLAVMKPRPAMGARRARVLRWAGETLVGGLDLWCDYLRRQGRVGKVRRCAGAAKPKPGHHHSVAATPPGQAASGPRARALTLASTEAVEVRIRDGAGAVAGALES